MYDAITVANSLFMVAKKQKVKIKNLRQLQILMFLIQYFNVKYYKNILISDAFHKSIDYPYVYIPTLSCVINQYGLLKNSSWWSVDEDSDFVNDGDILIHSPNFRKYTGNTEIDMENIEEWRTSYMESPSINEVIKAFGRHSVIDLKYILERDGDKLRYTKNSDNMLTINDIMNCDFKANLKENMYP